jgi:hypothetical protein
LNGRKYRRARNHDIKALADDVPNLIAAVVGSSGVVVA